MKKVLITGSKGFIGSNLVSSLDDHNICGLDSEYLLRSDWKIYLLTQLKAFQPDVVFHIGACAGTLEKRVNYMMVRNYESTKELVNWCKNNNVPFIYSSSAAAYGDGGLYPSNLYGWSKYVAEDYVLNRAGVALRYFNVYGPGEKNKGQMASIAYQSFLKHDRGEKVLLFPQRPSRDFVYVRDVVEANLYAWKHFDKLKGKYFEVGSGTSRSFEDIMDILSISYAYADKSLIPDGYQFYTCSDRSKWMPGWAPKYTLDDGLFEYKEYLENEKIK
jgi:ADP-L-glycero-D-manno-heptose 6-epimerase